MKATRSTSDHPRLKKLPKPVHEGADRSYTTRVPFGRFVVSAMTRTGAAARRGAWIVEDRATGAVEACWTLKECLAVIHIVMAPPTAGEGRFAILSTPKDPVTGSDCALYDRVTGRFWLRTRGTDLTISMQMMEQLADCLPEEYAQRRAVDFPPPPWEWRSRTSETAGEAGRASIKLNRWMRQQSDS